jgi:demethoxyubiquinone hydroxylase (CLK1/Coq7/Cat5 family)
MRVNHVGEVCAAQALYIGAFCHPNESLREHQSRVMLTICLTRQRLDELGQRPSC